MIGVLIMCITIVMEGGCDQKKENKGIHHKGGQMGPQTHVGIHFST